MRDALDVCTAQGIAQQINQVLPCFSPACLQSAMGAADAAHSTHNRLISRREYSNRNTEDWYVDVLIARATRRDSSFPATSYLTRHVVTLLVRQYMDSHYPTRDIRAADASSIQWDGVVEPYVMFKIASAVKVCERVKGGQANEMMAGDMSAVLYKYVADDEASLDYLLFTLESGRSGQIKMIRDILTCCGPAEHEDAADNDTMMDMEAWRRACQLTRTSLPPGDESGAALVWRYVTQNQPLSYEELGRAIRARWLAFMDTMNIPGAMQHFLLSQELTNMSGYVKAISLALGMGIVPVLLICDYADSVYAIDFYLYGGGTMVGDEPALGHIPATWLKGSTIINLEAVDEKFVGRARSIIERYDALKHALLLHGIVLRASSRLCKAYVMGTGSNPQLSLDYVVSKMANMKFLFEKTCYAKVLQSLKKKQQLARCAASGGHVSLTSMAKRIALRIYARQTACKSAKTVHVSRRRNPPRLS